TRNSVQRFERGMGEIRELVSGFEDLGCGGKGFLGVAVIARHRLAWFRRLSPIRCENIGRTPIFGPSLIPVDGERLPTLIAAHMFSPTTATPRGMATTSTTPFTALALLASKDLTVAPNIGGWTMTAVSIPGNLTSIVKGWVPLVFALES